MDNIQAKLNGLEDIPQGSFIIAVDLNLKTFEWGMDSHFTQEEESPVPDSIPTRVFSKLQEDP